MLCLVAFQLNAVLKIPQDATSRCTGQLLAGIAKYFAHLNFEACHIYECAVPDCGHSSRQHLGGERKTNKWPV